MTEVYRFGLQILPADPFWVQVREAVVQRAQQLGVTIVQLAFDAYELTGDGMVQLMDDLVTHELEAFIGQRLPRRLAQYLLNADLPIIYAEETTLHHTRLTAPRGLYDAAKLLGAYLADQGGPYNS